MDCEFGDHDVSMANCETKSDAETLLDETTGSLQSTLEVDHCDDCPATPEHEIIFQGQLHANEMDETLPPTMVLDETAGFTTSGLQPLMDDNVERSFENVEQSFENVEQSFENVEQSFENVEQSFQLTDGTGVFELPAGETTVFHNPMVDGLALQGFGVQHPSETVRVFQSNVGETARTSQLDESRLLKRVYLVKQVEPSTSGVVGVSDCAQNPELNAITDMSADAVHTTLSHDASPDQPEIKAQAVEVEDGHLAFVGSVGTSVDGQPIYIVTSAQDLGLNPANKHFHMDENGCMYLLDTADTSSENVQVNVKPTEPIKSPMKVRKTKANRNTKDVSQSWFISRTDKDFMTDKGAGKKNFSQFNIAMKSPMKVRKTKANRNTKDVSQSWFTSRSDKDFMSDKGAEWRRGVWQKDENDLLHDNITRYCEKHNITDPTKIIFNMSKDERKDFYRTISQGLQRPLFSVYRRVIRHYDPKNYLGKYSNHDMVKLAELHERYKNDWATIGAMMGRSASSVKDKCRLMRVRHSGKWTANEEVILADAVYKLTKPEDTSEHSTVTSAISWNDVSSMVKTRNPKQCRTKWLNYLDWKFKGGSEWGRMDDVTLIVKLCDLNPSSALDIDWDALYSDWSSVRSPQWLRTKFWSLKRHVPGYRDLPLSDILIYLRDTYIPSLHCKTATKEIVETEAMDFALPDTVIEEGSITSVLEHSAVTYTVTKCPQTSSPHDSYQLITQPVYLRSSSLEDDEKVTTRETTHIDDLSLTQPHSTTSHLNNHDLNRHDLNTHVLNTHDQNTEIQTHNINSQMQTHDITNTSTQLHTVTHDLNNTTQLNSTIIELQNIISNKKLQSPGGINITPDLNSETNDLHSVPSDLHPVPSVLHSSNSDLDSTHTDLSCQSSHLGMVTTTHSHFTASHTPLISDPMMVSNSNDLNEDKR